MTPTALACPSDDLLLAHAAGLASPAESALVAAHLDACPDCVALLAEAGRGLAADRLLSGGAPATGVLAATGATVGRYRLLEVIGRGAFGVVFLAHDPDLDRKVAVKLVRLGERAPELARRAILEAKAMARLSHPNVVTVHDVGTFEGGVYLAMELVEGTTLSAWLQARPRTWQAIVEVFAKAGDGLVAAHEVGLVHRDFKPDNVLIAESPGGPPRVLVTDFGLARANLDESASRAGTSARGRAVHAVGSIAPLPMNRTVEGSVLGTPAYMAPEQLRGETIDHRADVFAFGVSLFEALSGKLPFPGDSPEELLLSQRQSATMSPLAGRCPRRIARVIAKAIAPEPGARWPDMAALVTELRRDSRRRWWAFASLLVILGMALGWRVSTPSHDAYSACVQVGARSTDEVWSATRRAELNDALERTLGAALARRVELRLEAYVDAWGAARGRACDAVWRRGEQSEATLELKSHCLERRLDEFDALTALLASGDREVALRAPAAVSSLPGLSECESLVGLAERERTPIAPLPRALSQAADELSARAIAAELAGLWVQGAELARVAALFAEASEDQRTIGETLTALARLELLAGRPTEARQAFGRAIPTSFRADDDRGSAKGLIDLAYLLAVISDDAEEAHRLLDLAEALLHRLGGDLELEVRLRTSRAEVYTRRLDNTLAIAELERVQDLQARTRGVDDPTLVRTWDALGVAQQQAERYGEALASFDAGLRLALATLGPKHPDTLNLLGNLGYCLMKVGRYRESDAVLGELHPQMVAIFGANHWNPAIVRQMWALARSGLGDHTTAIAWHREGIAILRVAFSDSPGQLAYSLVALAESALMAEDYGLARESLEQARLLTEAHASSNGSTLATITLHEATLHAALGDLGQAEALWSRAAVDLLEYVGDGVSRAAARAGLARLALERGELSAVATLREVLALMDTLYGGPGPASARARLDLARALASTRPQEARGLLSEAAVALEGEAAEPELLAEILWAWASLEPAPELADELLVRARTLVAPRSGPRAERLVAEGLMLDGPWALVWR